MYVCMYTFAYKHVSTDTSIVKLMLDHLDDHKCAIMMRLGGFDWLRQEGKQNINDVLANVRRRCADGYIRSLYVSVYIYI